MMLAHSPHAFAGPHAHVVRETGIAALAIRAGRALETWGRRRAAHPDREQRLRRHENLVAAERRAHHDELMLRNRH